MIKKKKKREPLWQQFAKSPRRPETKLPAWAVDTTTQWPLPIWTDARDDAQTKRHVLSANRSKHAIPYSQPSSAVYIYYMHILTTQLIYKKAASKMSKNKNIFFHTPAPCLPRSRVQKTGAKRTTIHLYKRCCILCETCTRQETLLLLDSWQWGGKKLWKSVVKWGPERGSCSVHSRELTV